jgi:dipeptidyl aminopeptidase/acylaminoacyl peptidase
VARGRSSRSDLASDGTALYWLESRPADAGRVVLVRDGPDGRHDHSPPGVSIRSRVHEYGGGAVCLLPGGPLGAFAYVDASDQRIWLAHRAAAPRALSTLAGAGEEHRHGGLAASGDGAWVFAVREVHRDGAPRPTRAVVACATDAAPGRPREVTVLSGHGFYGAPRPDAAARRLAVVVWDHPDMPWDASTLLVVPLDRRDGDVVVAGPPWAVAGGVAESVGQPRWARDGSLRFVSDRRGWWQPYVHPGRPEAGPGGAVASSDTEGDWHGADWVLGTTTMAELPDGRTVGRVTRAGRDTVVALGSDGVPVPLGLPCVSVSALCAHDGGIAVLGATPATSTEVWVSTPGASARPLGPATPALPAPDVAVGEAFALTGRAGRPVYGTLYRPMSSARQLRPGPEGDRPPPLVVFCHSGPTSAWQSGLDLAVQFFTTRGFAVAGVDYTGSTGYGRAYRRALEGRWGVTDAEDCLDAARHLVQHGEADPARLAVRGSSAGGFTALNALAAGEGFAAAVSWYGVTDLVGLRAATHDFEASANERLVGPWPEAEADYVARSPVARAATMRGAVLLLHGTRDPVVPPEQAERMRDALGAAGTPCRLRFFEGEGHGFRRAETLAAAYEAELAFYLDVLGL